MTTYGTIPTSSSPGKFSDDIDRAKHRLKSQLATRMPWRVMFDYHTFGFPRSFGETMGRVKANLSNFRTNYAIIVLLAVFLSLIYKPVSLIVFVVIMLAWLLLYFLRDRPLVVFGYTIGDVLVLVVLSIITIVALILTKATLNVLVAVAVGIVVVLIHAVVRKTDDVVSVDEGNGDDAAGQMT